MATRKLKGSWWVDFRHDGLRYRIRCPDNSRASAAAYESLLRGRLARGEPIKPVEQKNASTPSFREFSAKWSEIYVRSNNKPSEQNSKRIILQTHLVPFFGNTSLDKITTLSIEEYKALKLKVGLNPKTVNNHITVLRTCLRHAKDWGVIEHLPTIKLLKSPPHKFDFLTQPEIDHLLREIRDPVWRDMVLVALKTGMRLGELIGLEWQDINFISRTITVRRSIVKEVIGSPKSNKERNIPISTLTAVTLQKRRQSKGYVFTRSEAGHMSQKTPHFFIAQLCKKAGMRRIGWHTFRHTFASQLAENGVPMKAIQELLGHSDIKTTMRYAHLQSSTLKEAIETLDEPKIVNFGQPVGNRSHLVDSTHNTTRIFSS